MFISDIIKVGEPLVNGDMNMVERIKLITDVAKDEVKNFYGNIFVIEIEDDTTATLTHFSLQDEENGQHNIDQAISLPITLPSGGNPRLAQGIYSHPTYPMYDSHIKDFSNVDENEKMIYSRLIRTIGYTENDSEQLTKKSKIIAECLEREGTTYITEERQLGVLCIIDYSIDLYASSPKGDSIPIKPKDSQNQIYISLPKLLERIIDAKFTEAKELGVLTDDISTFYGEKSSELVSAYNKSWLWLSHTWDMPRSIYWKKTDWVKGIRMNRREYEVFIYGSQFLRQVQTPIHSTIAKEMFAQTENVEAKKQTSPTRFDTVYGIPYFLPITEKSTVDVFRKFQVLQRFYEHREIRGSDLQLELLTGLEKRIIRDVADDYRITIIYYSGILNRGDIHIRAEIKDIVPSLASSIQSIIQKLNGMLYTNYCKHLHINPEQSKSVRWKVQFLPTLLSNAYGPGYLWSSMNKVFHGENIYLDRVRTLTNERIIGLIKEGDRYAVRLELLFYHLFVYFYKQYYEFILKEEGGCMYLTEWEKIKVRYEDGMLQEEDLSSTEKIGFLVGCLVQQYESSFYAKTQRGFLDTRIMRFGSRLTPEMIWKNGLLRMKELQKQWDLGIRKNFDQALASILPKMMELQRSHQLSREKDEFMTMFWSGYLMKLNLKTSKEEEAHVDSQW